MPNFKDTQNNLHFLDDAQFIYLLPEGSLEITDEEAEAIRLDAVVPPPIPSVVSMRQARLALLQLGLLSTVDASVAAGSEADKITWEYATEVNRNEALVQNLAVVLGLSEQDLDNLFALASSL